MFFSALQCVIYTGCVTWDHLAEHSAANDFLTIGNTCLSKGMTPCFGRRRLRSGLGKNPYVMVQAVVFGLASIIAGRLSARERGRRRRPGASSKPRWVLVSDVRIAIGLRS